ncbi:MAG: toll/interleukin-1 receptor domain-containing protein [Acidimicrobiales bacterium]
MGGIFISYRRDDTAYIAGRLRDDLAEQFGDAFVVFRDIETMPLGPFPEQLAAAIADADAVLVVIGDGWLGPRLHAPQDWVRREIAAALEQNKVVVPVLVEGAPFPAAGDLPANIQALVMQQVVEVPDARWEYELGRLVDRLRVVLGVPAGTRVVTGPWSGPEAPVRLTVDKIEVQAATMRFHVAVENATADELFLPADTFDVTDDTGHQYTSGAAASGWPTDVPPGTARGTIDIGEGLQSAAAVIEAGWVRALGTFEVGSVYATVRLRR